MGNREVREKFITNILDSESGSSDDDDSAGSDEPDKKISSQSDKFNLPNPVR